MAEENIADFLDRILKAMLEDNEGEAVKFMKPFIECAKNAATTIFPAYAYSFSSYLKHKDWGKLKEEIFERKGLLFSSAIAL